MSNQSHWDAVAALAPVRRRMLRNRIVRFGLRGLAGGAAAGSVVLIAAHAAGLQLSPALGPAALVCGALAGAILALRRQPDTHHAARLVDRHFALHDRMTTALEFQHSDEPLAILQRVEAERKLETLHPIESVRLRPSGRDLTLPALAALALTGALMWGGAPTTQARPVSSTSDRSRIERAAGTQLPAITRQLEHGVARGAVRNPALQKLEAALSQLRRQMLHAANRPAALRAISATQLQLHRLAASLHPINHRAVSALNRSLAHYLKPVQQASASASNTRALQAAAQMLNHLARTMSHMTAAQRAALARSLAQAANTVNDSRLRSSLQQAASSLAYHDTQSASAALQQAANALRATPGARAARSTLGQASSQLDSLKNSVSGVADAGGANAPPSATSSQNSANESQNPSSGQISGGKGTGQGAGQSTGKASGQGTGRGLGQGSTSGSGSQKGRGTGSGSGQGSGTGAGGKGGIGGHGGGGGRGSAGPHGHGHYTTVFVPQHSTNGPHATQIGPSGAPQGGPLVPYQEVVGQYAQTAHTALDRSALPPSVQAYVRRYFTDISH